MKYAFIILLITNVCCSNNNQGKMINEGDEKSLRYLKEVEWPKAYHEQDTLLLDRLLGEDFQMIDAEGNWTDKKFEMNWIKQHTDRPDSFHYEIKRLQILENGTAIIAGTGHIFNDTTETIYQSLKKGMAFGKPSLLMFQA